jgi:hypothetical protein
MDCLIFYLALDGLLYAAYGEAIRSVWSSSCFWSSDIERRFSALCGDSNDAAAAATLVGLTSFLRCIDAMLGAVCLKIYTRGFVKNEMNIGNIWYTCLPLNGMNAIPSPAIAIGTPNTISTTPTPKSLKMMTSMIPTANTIPNCFRENGPMSLSSESMNCGTAYCIYSVYHGVTR